MNQCAHDIVAAGRVDLDVLHGCEVPRISIVAFCETPAEAETIAAAAGDRRMARASVDVRTGGIQRAIEQFRDAPSPDLLLLESGASGDNLLSDLDGLAEVCDPDTKVLVIGASNDVMLYRELVDRGVADYLVGPLSEPMVIAAVGRLFRNAAPRKLGRTCAFIGAKGGVGASTVAHNVAWSIAGEFASKVVLADMDLPFGTAGLDFNIDADQGIVEAVDDKGRLDELLLDRLLVKCSDHLSLLAAPATLGRAYDFDEPAFDRMLEIARGHAANVILDLPHLWTGWARHTLAIADEVVIVAEPDLANLRNAKSLVEHLVQARPNDVPPKLVLNRVGMPKRPEIKAADFASALDLEPMASIGFDPGVFGAAANEGKMIASAAAKSPACGSFADIARIVSGRAGTKASRNAAFGARVLRALGVKR